MKLNNNIKPFPTYLSDAFKDIVNHPKPLRNDGIIFKRDSQSREEFIKTTKDGKITKKSMKHLVDNQIPY